MCTSSAKPDVKTNLTESKLEKTIETSKRSQKNNKKKSAVSETKTVSQVVKHEEMNTSLETKLVVLQDQNSSLQRKVEEFEFQNNFSSQKLDEAEEYQRKAEELKDLISDLKEKLKLTKDENKLIKTQKENLEIKQDITIDSNKDLVSKMKEKINDQAKVNKLSSPLQDLKLASSLEEDEVTFEEALKMRKRNPDTVLNKTKDSKKAQKNRQEDSLTGFSFVNKDQEDEANSKVDGETERSSLHPEQTPLSSVEVESLKKNIQELEHTLEHKEAVLKQERANTAKAKSNVLKEFQKEIDQNEIEIENYLKDNTNLNSKVEDLSQQIENQKNDMKDREEDRDDIESTLKAQIKKFVLRIDELTEEASKSKDNGKCEDNTPSINTIDHSDLQVQIDEKDAQLQTLNNKLCVKEEESRNKIKDLVESLSNFKASSESQRNQDIHENDNLNQTIKSLNDQIEVLNSEKNEHHSKLSDVLNATQNLVSSDIVDDLNHKSDQLRKDLEKSNAEISNLNKTNANKTNELNNEILHLKDSSLVKQNAHKDEINKIIEEMKLSNDGKEKEIIIKLQDKNSSLTSILSEAQNECEKVTTNFNQLSEEQKELKTKVKDQTKKIDDQLKLCSSLKNSKEELYSEHEQLSEKQESLVFISKNSPKTADVELLKSKLANLGLQVSNNVNTLNEVSKKHEDTKSQLKSSSKQHTEAQQINEQLKNQLDAHLIKTKASTQQTELLRTQLDSQDKQRLETNEYNGKLRNQTEVLQAEVNTFKSEIATLKSKCNELKGNTNSDSVKIRGLNSKIESLELDNSTVKGKLKKVEKNLLDTFEANTSLGKEIELVKSQYSDLESMSEKSKKELETSKKNLEKINILNTQNEIYKTEMQKLKNEQEKIKMTSLEQIKKIGELTTDNQKFKGVLQEKLQLQIKIDSHEKEIRAREVEKQEINNQLIKQNMTQLANEEMLKATKAKLEKESSSAIEKKKEVEKYLQQLRDKEGELSKVSKALDEANKKGVSNGNNDSVLLEKKNKELLETCENLRSLNTKLISAKRNI